MGGVQCNGHLDTLRRPQCAGIPLLDFSMTRKFSNIPLCRIDYAVNLSICINPDRIHFKQYYLSGFL